MSYGVNYEWTAEDRERWREEVREAKRTLTPEEFKSWLYRKTDWCGRA